MVLPDDLTRRFGAWKSEVSAALESWPALQAQFDGSPAYGLSLFKTERECIEIEHRSQVLDGIVRALDEGAVRR
jgi:hypothetical protein